MKKLLYLYRDHLVSPWIVLVMDMFIVTFSFVFSTVVRFNFDLEYIDPSLFKYHLLLASGTGLVFFLVFGTHKGIIRHTGTEATRSLLSASFVSVAALALPNVLSPDELFSIPFSILLISFFVSVFGLLGSRFLIRNIFRSLSKAPWGSMEDLLERPVIRINNHGVREFLEGRRVLVTGAAGSIGSELVRQIAEFGPQEIILLDQAESALYDLESDLTRMKNRTFDHLRLSVEIESITHRDRMQALFERYRPQVVFHAAAYKHVPMMESNPVKSVEVNVLGAQYLADLSVEYGVEKFVFISTDKAVNPVSVMGASKRLAEIYVQSLDTSPGVRTRFVTTRFGNVLGSNGSVVPLFRKQIEKGGPVTVTHPDINRYFMTIPEACQLVLEAGTTDSGGEVFVFDMGEPVRILDIALKMIRLYGKEPYTQIPVVFTELRPGEKLHEELLSDEEFILPTHHPKIMVAGVKPALYRNIKAELDRVVPELREMTNWDAVQFLKSMVPEYIPKNSPYENPGTRKTRGTLSGSVVST